MKGPPMGGLVRRSRRAREIRTVDVGRQTLDVSAGRQTLDVGR
ncbi:hypothetical protein T261_06677 [Streptomyces lydicus]|nr:hypothetical protein T261_06677 [Streptomyces lydicus]